MADIFVSYARENRAIANALVATLENHGWSVWWDQLIPAGTLFDNDIEDNLRNAKCIIVLWSQASVGSNWVRAEALRGFDRNNLIPVIIEEVEVPPPFNVYQAVHLADLRKPWTGVDLDAVTAAVRLKLSQTHGPVTQTHGAATQTHGPATEPYSDYLPNLPVPQLAAGLKRLRIANYNINNLFSRSSSLLARELGEKGDYINDLHGLKNLLARKSYAGSTGDKIVHLLEKYEFHMPVRERKRIAEFTIYQADERLYSIARGRIRLLASGNSDWHGYIRPFSRLLSESSVANVICQGILIQSLSANSSSCCRQGDPSVVGKQLHPLSARCTT